MRDPLADVSGHVGQAVRGAAVGLAGKVLGPFGMFWLIWSGAWPVSAIVLCLTNDFIWWIPFGLYLQDAWPSLR